VPGVEGLGAIQRDASGSAVLLPDQVLVAHAA
jgi:hypothetical protein